MKIIEKYLSKNVLTSSLSIISILSFIILITQSFKYIDLVISYGSKSSDFIYLSILLLPSLLFIIIPLCLFISVMYTLNKLNNQRELTILKSAGMNNFSIAKPILKVALLISLFHYFLSLFLLPSINSSFKDLTKDIKENYINFFLQEKVFNHPAKYLTFYIKNKVSDTKFEHVFYQDARNNSTVTLVAKEGELVKKDDKIFLSLKDGNRQEILPNNDFNILNFQTLFVELDFSKKDGFSRTKAMQEKNLFELLIPQKDLDYGTKLRGYAEATNRLLWPLYNIMLTLIALYTFLEGEFNRSGKLKRIIIYSCTAAVATIANNSLINLGSNNVFSLILCYIFTFSLGYYLCKKINLFKSL